MRLRISKIRELATARPAGYYKHVISLGAVDGDFLEISSEAHATLRKAYRPDPPMPVRPDIPENDSRHPQLATKTQITGNGPGSIMKSMIARLGLRPAVGCKCNARAAMMDHLGPDWCQAHIEEIVGWLKEEAMRAKLPFFAPAARLLVNRAIKKARSPLSGPFS